MRTPSHLRLLALLAIALSGLAFPVATPVQAQAPTADLYAFEIVAPQTRVDVPINGQVILPLTFRDQSRDSLAAFNPALPPNSFLFHQVRFEVVPEKQDSGWTVYPPTSLTTYGGTDWPLEMPFQVNAQAQNVFYPVNLTAIITTLDGSVHYANASFLGFSLGPRSFAAQVGQSFQAKPNQILEAPVRLINLGLGPRSFDMEVVDNPCDLGVATANNNLVLGKSEAVYTVSVETPDDKPWYFSELCTVTVQVYPTGQKDVFQTVFIGVQVNGGYIDPLWVIYAVLIALALILLLLFLARRKARIEEEILGKPQKPWLIPVEALYLRALKEKDERAWYVVRHYLMEDEYRSSLLWYRNYKKATKGQRKKEGLVLTQEKGYERWKKAWQRDIARPIRRADRFEAKLQRKLDRKAAKAHRKQMGKYGKVVEKMKAAHAKQVERAGKQHAKAVAKAAKKGESAPKRPVVPEPDYPEEPQLTAIPLATHKWAKKAARYRAKQVRRQVGSPGTELEFAL